MEHKDKGLSLWRAQSPSAMGEDRACASRSNWIFIVPSLKCEAESKLLDF